MVSQTGTYTGPTKSDEIILADLEPQDASKTCVSAYQDSTVRESGKVETRRRKSAMGPGQKKRNPTTKT